MCAAVRRSRPPLRCRRLRTADTEEKRQTDAVRVPGAAVVGSYGEVVKAIFNTEEDK